MAGMFKAKVLFVLALSMANACVSVSLGSQTDSPDPNFAPPKQQVHIRVFNRARVPRRDVSRSEAEVSRIFAEADMAVSWAEGALDDRHP
jgi:hypothetical protein